MAGRVEGVFSGTPERSVVELLRTWWGITCPSVPDDSDHPPLLRRLWAAEVHRLAWGHQDVLLPSERLTRWKSGQVEFFVENQSVWRVAYEPSEGPNPAVVALVDGSDGKEVLALGINLHEFLARTLVIEAVFGATWWTNGELLSGNDIDEWLIWPEHAAHSELFRMPALYSDGNTLCFAFDPHATGSAFYGAQTRDELSTSAFAGCGRWFEPSRGSGPVFAPE